MTELKTMITRGRLALKDDKATLKSVAQAMVAGEAVELPETIELPALPKKIELVPAVKQAMDGISTLFCMVVPETRRTLTEQELKTLHLERTAIKLITGALTGREEAIKETVRNHMDEDAIAKGVGVRKALVDSATGEVIVEATPRDVHGHLVTATAQKRDEVQIPGTDQVFVREYRAPQTTVSVEDLFDLVADGKVTKDEYLAMTRQTRVISEDKVWDFVKRNPERGLEILGSITKHGLPSTAFNVRKAK
jgi:hypothetical protein